MSSHVDWKKARLEDTKRFNVSIHELVVWNLTNELTLAKNALVNGTPDARKSENLAQWFAYASIGKRYEGHPDTERIANDVLRLLQRRLDNILVYLQESLDKLVTDLPTKERKLFALTQDAEHLLIQIATLTDNITIPVQAQAFDKLKADATKIKEHYSAIEKLYYDAYEKLAKQLDGSAIMQQDKTWNLGPVKSILEKANNRIAQIQTDFPEAAKVAGTGLYTSHEISTLQVNTDNLGGQLVDLNTLMLEIKDSIRELVATKDNLTRRRQRYLQIVTQLNDARNMVTFVRNNTVSQELRSVLHPENFVVPTHFLNTSVGKFSKRIPLEGLEDHYDVFSQLAEKAEIWDEWLDQLSAVYRDTVRSPEWGRFSEWGQFTRTLIDNHDTAWLLWKEWHEIPSIEELQQRPANLLEFNSWLMNLAKVAVEAAPSTSAAQVLSDLQAYIIPPGDLTQLAGIGIDRQRKIEEVYKTGPRLENLKNKLFAKPNYERVMMNEPEADLLDCFEDSAIWESLLRPDFDDQDLALPWSPQNGTRPMEEIQDHLLRDMDNVRTTCAKLDFILRRFKEYADYCISERQSVLDGRTRQERKKYGDKTEWDEPILILTEPTKFSWDSRQRN